MSLMRYTILTSEPQTEFSRVRALEHDQSGPSIFDPARSPSLLTVFFGDFDEGTWV